MFFPLSKCICVKIVSRLVAWPKDINLDDSGQLVMNMVWYLQCGVPGMTQVRLNSQANKRTRQFPVPGLPSQSEGRVSRIHDCPFQTRAFCLSWSWLNLPPTTRYIETPSFFVTSNHRPIWYPEVNLGVLYALCKNPFKSYSILLAFTHHIQILKMKLPIAKIPRFPFSAPPECPQCLSANTELRTVQADNRKGNAGRL